MTLMTHAIVAYPTLKESMKIVLQQEKAGADYIELQLPFSDPLGDGHVIMNACTKALANKLQIKDCFSFITSVCKKVKVPIILMTYCNLPYRYGYHNFVNFCLDAGVSGLIVPDLPYDEPHENLYHFAAAKNLPTIPVISSNTSVNRLEMLASMAKYLVYCTLKIGVTGMGAKIQKTRLMDDFFSNVHRYFDVPVLGGFGVKSVEDTVAIKDYVDTVVIGSQLIQIYEKSGLRGLGRFIENVKKAIT